MGSDLVQLSSPLHEVGTGQAWQSQALQRRAHVLLPIGEGPWIQVGGPLVRPPYAGHGGAGGLPGVGSGGWRSTDWLVPRLAVRWPTTPICFFLHYLLCAPGLSGHVHAISRAPGWCEAGGGDPDWDNSLVGYCHDGVDARRCRSSSWKRCLGSPYLFPPHHFLSENPNCGGRRRRSWCRVLLEGVIVRALWWWAPFGFMGSCKWRLPD